MTDRVFSIFDLGPGDGGKGGAIHALCCRHHPHTVVKIGGAQGQHGAQNKRTKFCFSQWGCGTLEGIKTHITPLMIISPTGMLKEADCLRYIGITNAFDLLTVDESALCATPYHGIFSRITELTRTTPRGTVGTGVGVAHRIRNVQPDLTIRASDLRDGSKFHNLSNKLSRLRDYYIAKTSKLGQELVVDITDEDRELIQIELNLLYDPGFLKHNIERFREVGEKLNVVEGDHIRQILAQDGDVVIESSHGILTDNALGFHPHVSAIRTLPTFVTDYLRQFDYNGEIVNIGVHRAYSVRHGAGPMPTHCEDMTEKLAPGSHKNENRYQGKVRVGPLDFMLLRYAVENCGVDIDGIALTWCDDIHETGKWEICEKYKFNEPSQLEKSHRFISDGKLLSIDPAENVRRRKYQQELGSFLEKCVPEFKTIDMAHTSTDELLRLCNREMLSRLDIPIHLISFGPTEQETQFAR